MLRAVLLWYSVGLLACMAHVTFTNLKCLTPNETLVEYPHCYIKAVNRTHKYISIHAKFYITDYSNITINVKLLRYDHGYKPFFFDLTFDACKFIKNQNNAFVSLFYDQLKKSSNLNHTCPYDVDIIVDKFWSGNLEKNFLKYLPIPNGDYAVFVTVFTYNYELSCIQYYVKITS